MNLQQNWLDRDGVQDVLTALRLFPNDADLATSACGAVWSLAVNGTRKIFWYIEWFLSEFIYTTSFLIIFSWWQNLNVNVTITITIENNCKIVAEERGFQDICMAMQSHDSRADLIESACSALWWMEGDVIHTLKWVFRARAMIHYKGTSLSIGSRLPFWMSRYSVRFQSIQTLQFLFMW